MFRRTLLIFFVLAGILPAQGVRASAQQPSPFPSPAGPQMLRVARITPWLDATHPFTAVIQITNTSELALTGVKVFVSVFGRVVSRTGLALAIDRGATTPLLGFTSDPVTGAIAAGEQRTIVFTRDASKLARFNRTGVYPVQITIRSSAGTEYALTAEPYLSSPARTQINMSVLLPVGRPTAQRADGIFPAATAQMIAPDEISQQMESIAAHPGLAVTLAPSPSLLDTLAQLSAGFAVHGPATVQAEGKESPAARAAGAALNAIKRAAANVGEIATVPYAPADLPGLLQHGLRADLLRQVTFGRSIATSRLGRAPSLSAFVPPGLRLDAGTLNALLPLGVTSVVAGAQTLTSLPSTPYQPQNFGPSRPITLDLPGGRDVPALLADPQLSVRAASQEQGVLAGQAVVAMSATAWLELPLFSPDRVILVAPDTLPDPPALTALLDGLSTAPWVHLRTVTDALNALPPQSGAQLASASGADTPYLERARAARRALTMLGEIVTTPPPEIDTLDRNVLLSESSEWNSSPSTGAALAAAVVLRVRAITRAIHVVPRQVTLTSRRGSVPVTLVNGNSFPLSVRVTLSSAKVTFPAGAARIVTLAPPNQTVDFAIKALATGAFPLDVRVDSADGRHELATGRLIVRSTAVSAVALAVVGSGIALLLFGSMRRGRRRQTAPKP